MGVIVEGFKEIFYQAKDGMNILDEGLSDETMAGQLLVMNKVVDNIISKAKSVKKQIKDESALIAENLDGERKNPNATLDKFADEEEVSKTAGDGEADATVQSSFSDTTPPAEDVEDVVKKDGDEPEHIDLTGVDPEGL